MCIRDRCKSFGIDVVIFRGNDRNRRRGFHNIWIYSKILRSNESFKKEPTIVFDESYRIEDPKQKCKFLYEILPNPKNLRKVAIVTYCTQEKRVDINKIHKKMEERGLDVPGFDLEREKEYREILKEYIRPAREIYAGTFKNVWKLAEEFRSQGIKTEEGSEAKKIKKKKEQKKKVGRID